MLCWSCERAIAPTEVFCPVCGAIAAPDPTVETDDFALLGQPRRFSIDVAAAEARYKELARTTHPDRFARADPRARRAALQRTVQVNEAWRRLKDPDRRAERLLALAGVQLGDEDGAKPVGSAAQTEAGGAKRRATVSPELLMETLELREALADAKHAQDVRRVDSLRAQVESKLHATRETLARALDAGTELDAAAQALAALRYYRRFLDEAGSGEST